MGQGLDYLGEVVGPDGTQSFGPQPSSSKQLGALPAGRDYTWRVRARNAGGTGPWSAQRTFTVALAPPIQLQGQVASCTSASLSWRDNSTAEDGYRIYRNGTVLSEVGANATGAVLQSLSDDASHAFTVRAFRLNRESAAAGPVTLNTPPCDTAPPAATWDRPTDGSTLRQAVEPLQVTASDSGSGVDHVDLQARWNGDWHDIKSLRGSSPYRYNWDLCAAGVPDGAVDLRLHAVDTVGNEATQTIQVSKRVNCSPNEPPAQPRFAGLQDGDRLRGLATLEIEASDSYDTANELTVDYRVDDGPFVGASFDTGTGHFAASWDTAAVSDGPHALRARVTDSAGLDAQSEPVQVVVDNVSEAPVANAGEDQTLTDGNGNGSESVTLDASQSTYDPQRSVTYAWEERTGHNAVPLGTGRRLTVDFAVGTHTVALVVTDDDGNRDEDVLVVHVNPRPATMPRLEISPGAGRRGQSVKVTANGYEPTEDISLTWDPGKTDVHGKGGKKGGGHKKGKGKKGHHGKKRNTPQVSQSVSVGHMTADASGNASATIEVPAAAPLGTSKVTAVGDGGDRATATFKVEAGAARRAARNGSSAPPDSNASDDNSNDPTAAPDPGSPVAVLPDTTGEPQRAPSKRHSDKADHHSPHGKGKRAKAPRSHHRVKGHGRDGGTEGDKEGVG
jgi:hypothetical protein